MKEVLAVALGGAVGSVGRYGVNIVCTRLWGTHEVAAVLIVNTVGCLLIGALAGAALGRDPVANALLAVGFLGGLTTFSTFGLETVQLLQSSQWSTAALSVAGNVLFGCAAVAIGLKLGARWFG